MADVTIRPVGAEDSDAVWAMLEPVLRDGTTYALDPDMQRDDALAFWLGPEKSVFVADLAGAVIGTFYVKANAAGGGGHVANAGFVTHPDARGRGVAKAMLDAAVTTARGQGFRAMQFNFVVATNTGAIALWQRNGFDVVGRLPGAFDHPVEGFVDAMVMYRAL